MSYSNCYFLFILYYKIKIEIIHLEKNNYINSYCLAKDELLQKCYQSRSYYYIQSRDNEMKKYNLSYNDSNLVSIQDKINYLIIHESPDIKSKIADKIRLHNYSIAKLGKDICVPILKIYNNVNEINLEELPNKFVLKCNHGSGYNILCNNKSNFNLTKAKIQLNDWININFGLKMSEFQYINIKREIFAETYLKDYIEDYKIYCFHGIPKFVRVQKVIETGGGKINNFYDLNWKLTDMETGLPYIYRRPDIIFEKPKNFKLMLLYSKKLSEDFVFVRVDFYNINGKIYLGEMTFSPNNARFSMKNREQSIATGKLIDLSKIKQNMFN